MSDDKDMISRFCARYDLTVREWRDDPENGITGALGNFRVIDGDEDAGLYEGDEGELTACVVGAAKYGNQRVAVQFTPEGYDGGSDVRCLDDLEEID